MKFILPPLFALLLISCANIVVPTGGPKDISAPHLVRINSEVDIKTPQKRIISFEFNEFISPNNWEANFYISPPIKKRIQKRIKMNTLILTIEDTLVQNTTYEIALNNCIKDLNEGNLLDSLNYIFSTSEKMDTLNLTGNLQDAYTLDPLNSAWIMLFHETKNDSLIFKETPDYIAKTDKDGNFSFPNLNASNYKIVALTDLDFIYNEEEKIAFNTVNINAEKDSFISLLAFNPSIQNSAGDSTIIPPGGQENDSLLLGKEEYGNVIIITSESYPCIFQLFQKNTLIKEWSFIEKPFLLDNIVPGQYQLKFIHDADQNGEWTSGNWENKTLPEKVLNYPAEITIRRNWDLELDWIIE